MFSYYEPNFFEKILWESVFQTFANAERHKIKIGYLVAILKWYNTSIFSRIMVFDSAYIMVQISLQNSGGKVVFLGGSMDPWALTGVKVPWSPKS